MMELENGMVSGAMPYNQSDAPAKAIKCPWCKRVVDGDEYMVEYSGEWICTDCLKAEVSNMSLVELAEIMQLSARKARLV
jgi:hypothetical protein